MRKPTPNDNNEVMGVFYDVKREVRQAVEKEVKEEAHRDKRKLSKIFTSIILVMAVLLIGAVATIFTMETNPKLVLWSDLTPQERAQIRIQALAYFPEIFSSKFKTKYKRFNAYAISKGVDVPMRSVSKRII